MNFTVAVAHVLHHTNSRDLHDINHISLFAKYIAGRQLLDNARFSEDRSVALCLREVFQQSDDTVLDLQVCIWLKQAR